MIFHYNITKTDLQKIFVPLFKNIKVKIFISSRQPLQRKLKNLQLYIFNFEEKINTAIKYTHGYFIIRFSAP